VFVARLDSCDCIQDVRGFGRPVFIGGRKNNLVRSCKCLWGFYTYCTQFISFYYKDGEVTGDMENVKRSLA